MKPGEVITKKEEIDLNKDSKVTKVKISNSGDRPVQVGSHYHFFASISITSPFLRSAIGPPIAASGPT